MDNIERMQIEQSTINLINNLPNILLMNKFPLEDEFLKIATLIEIRDDITVIFTTEYIMTSNDILMIYYL
jgi:hypothetical protein